MTVKSSLLMSYNEILSTQFDIINVNVDDGMLEEHFLPPRRIQEQAVRGKDRRYFQGVEYEPIELELNLAFTSGFDGRKLKEVATWLCQDYYKPLWFSDNPSRIFYAMYEGEPTLIHTGNGQGYISITMRCDSPYSYSPWVVDTHDFSENGSNGTVLEFFNNGNVICKPEIKIKKVTNGDFRIVNHHKDDEEFSFTGLVDGETVIVDNEREDISTDLPNTYRYNNFNNNYLEMSTGNNVLVIYGKAIVQFRYRFKIFQG